MVGTFLGLYLGNKKFQQAINAMFRNKDEDDDYEDYDDDD
jgi:hypothetical protein